MGLILTTGTRRALAIFAAIAAALAAAALAPTVKAGGFSIHCTSDKSRGWKHGS